MRTWRLAILCIGAAVLGLPATGRAQPPEAAETLRQDILQLRMEFERLRDEYDNRLSALEAKLAALQPSETVSGQQPTTPPSAAGPATPTAEVPPGAAGAGGPTGALPVYGGAAAGSKIFNPDIAVIGDFLGAAGANRVNPEPGARDARIRGVVPGHRRSVRARRLLHGVRRRGRRARRGLHHVPDVAGRVADEGREDCARRSAR